MAGAKDDPTTRKYVLYDADDEWEIFSVELIYNLMQYLDDENIYRLPDLPRQSRHYSDTFFKSLAIGWHFMRGDFLQIFRSGLPYMQRSTRDIDIFTFAITHAVEHFKNMLPFPRLVFLAAYCYELSCFLCRHGREDLMFVSYTMFTTIWKDYYEAEFHRAGGWPGAEEALTQFALIFEISQELFVPGTRFDYHDLMRVLDEYEIFENRGREASQQVTESQVEEQGVRTRRRPANRKNWKVRYFTYVIKSGRLEFSSNMSASDRERIIEHLRQGEMQDEGRVESAALPTSYTLEESEAPSPSEDLNRNLRRNESVTESCRLRLQSCSIHGTEESDNEDSSKDRSTKDADIEKEAEAAAAATGARPKRRKSVAPSRKSVPRKSLACAATASGAKPKVDTKKKSDDQTEKMKRPETSKSAEEPAKPIKEKEKVHDP